MRNDAASLHVFQTAPNAINDGQLSVHKVRYRLTGKK
jgi:hypothetical protein